ncbi:hypothetical protein O181_066260 [Austropuccinia psidii MF-1]|uniref:Uncharacterized protein n=1 Tax=Austropuccinia psidii MF-1 TaxID=1389203 RepID=A0A9Q3ENN9_9BASI|nr:hypothetical protein [Austropuccinia psidii MF-1]
MPHRNNVAREGIHELAMTKILEESLSRNHQPSHRSEDAAIDLNLSLSLGSGSEHSVSASHSTSDSPFELVRKPSTDPNLMQHWRQIQHATIVEKYPSKKPKILPESHKNNEDNDKEIIQDHHHIESISTMHNKVQMGQHLSSATVKRNHRQFYDKINAKQNTPHFISLEGGENSNWSNLASTKISSEEPPEWRNKANLIQRKEEIITFNSSRYINLLSKYKAWRLKNSGVGKSEIIPTLTQYLRTQSLFDSQFALGNSDWLRLPIGTKLEFQEFISGIYDAFPQKCEPSSWEESAKKKCSWFIAECSKLLVARVRLISESYYPTLFKEENVVEVQVEALKTLENFWKIIFAAEASVSNEAESIVAKAISAREYFKPQGKSRKEQVCAASWLMTEVWMQKNFGNLYLSLKDDLAKKHSDFKLLIGDRALVVYRKASTNLESPRTLDHFFYLPSISEYSHKKTLEQAMIEK